MTWWRRVWRQTALERELDKELRFHVEQHATDLVARGIDSREAVRRAHVALGGAEQVKEECRDVRGTRWLNDLLYDVQFAVRTFRKLPGFAAVALLILSLGIAATTVMFTVINSVLLRPLSYPEPDRLVAVHGFTEAFGEVWGFSYPDFTDLRDASHSLSTAAWTYGGGTMTEPGPPEYLTGRQVSAELFAVLGLPLVHGRAFRGEEDRLGAPPVAIISYALWQRRFGGNVAAIDQRFVFDGTSYIVVGVAPPRVGLEGDADIYVPLGQNTDVRIRNRDARFIHVIARLTPGAAATDAQAELTLNARRLAAAFPQSDGGRTLLTRPLRQEVVGDIGSTLWLLLAAVSVVLVIACVNIASLLLARAASRERELATRVALGADRNRVIRQCLTETAVLGIAGGAIGVVLAAVSIGPFVAAWPGSLPRAEDIQLDWRVLAAAVVVSIASGIAFGLAPALRVPMSGLDAALRAGGRSIAGTSRRVHSSFVVTEMALAVLLLVCAGMLARTLVTLSSLDSGLNAHNVVTARVALSPAVLATPDRIRAAWLDVIDRAGRVPGVQSVTLTDIIPMRTGDNALPYSTTPVTRTANDAPVALASTVTPGYLAVMGIPLRAGRFFDEHDGSDAEHVLVVDETLARQAFGRRDVVGAHLWIPAMGPSPLTIVGVVGHVRHWGLAADDGSRVRAQIYYPFAQVPPSLLRMFSSFMSIAVRTRVAPLDVVEPLRQELRGAAGDHAIYQVLTMEQLVTGSLARQRFLLLLFGIFGAIALLLACVGVYGVLAYLTTQRTAEIGVRMALGATGQDVVRLVIRQSVVLIAIGVAVGLSGAWLSARLLERLVEGMRPPDPATLAAMTGMLAMAALLASFIPARRAGRVDVVQALRQD
jgi:putative ABC transport system permease protein